ncbi:hypothetical protein GCM10011297_12120 [Bacterioplanes sanyensis]|uniref:alpha/beta fold hydrolase n=1 Tax=Bacterioplanes sanyensis TaxID=1249553 RepID=UPI001678CAE8|nr:alpha/beta hydrolase [Bacterioplanes sanyensis]GGY40745.1 hypothetical protein GCM10011297_12120 [Bacterioplanes sanyensis]
MTHHASIDTPSATATAPQHLPLTCNDGQTVSASYWNTADADTVIHITHGMAEHHQRYQPLVETLIAAGYAVISHNHRGHGERAPLGHFADQHGWQRVIDDIVLVQQQCQQNNVILFGHSMGSFIAQGFARRHSEQLQGLILSGSNYQSPWLYQLARTVARVQAKLKGPRHLSDLMNTLSFASFNRAFKPAQTPFDWLSRDAQQVQAYVDDPRCGHLCSAQLWADLMTGLIEISQANALSSIRADLPVLLIAGDRDPVGQFGKGVERLAQQFRQTGHHNVTCTLYPDARHEVLNEINADQVRNDILQWLNQQGV